MADRSKIEWTDASWNPLRARNLKTGKVGWHCEHATTGCEHCYSEGFNKRLGTGLPFKPGHRKDIEIFLDEQMLTQPLRWKKPRKIFVCSMTDAFADFVSDEMLDKMFAVMALCPQHTFQVPTKRSARMRRYMLPTCDLPVMGRLPLERIHLAAAGAVDAYKTWGWCRNAAMAATPYNLYMQAPWPLRNVWLGVSAERQQEANERIPDLCATPAAVRFVSLEPLLGPIDLAPWLAFVENDPNDPRMVFDEKVVADGIDLEQVTLDWVIVGGESGRNARPMHPDWTRALRDQCAAAKVAFFYKQWGEWLPSTELRIPFQYKVAHVMPDGRVREDDLDHPNSRLTHLDMRVMCRVGKKVAGRKLDGVEHNEFPRVPA